MRRWLALAMSLLCLAAFGCLLYVHTGLLAGLPPGRVEALHPAGREALETAAAQAGLKNAAWEGDRLVIDDAALLTGAALEAGLLLTGQDAGAAVVLDYAWADEVLEQSAQSWRILGAVLLLWLLWRLARGQAVSELALCREALEHEYLAQYLDRNAVRLLAKAVCLALGVFGAALLLRWLWRLPISLPPTLLPEGSLFQTAHYRRWAAEHFPPGLCSEYGLHLAEVLKQAHTLAALECLALLPPAVCAGTVNRGKNLHNGGGSA